MKRSALVSFGVATALLCSVSVSSAADKASEKFITMAIQGNLAEVQMGQLAAQNGQSDAVKSFGQTLVKDHTDANQRATTAASSLGVTPPTEPTKKQQSDYQKMSKVTGAKFDREFAQHMVMDHKKDISAYQKASKMKNADAAATYASQTLPTLQQHLQTAQSLTKASGKSAAGKTM
jgi:putative membrane protein